jgi:hypothetical protein
VLTDIYLARGLPDKCDPLVHILVNSVERFPESGIALAKYFHAKGDFWSAIVSLNAAAHSLGWRAPPELRHAPPHPEEWLLRHPLAGPQFEFALIVAKLVAAVGTSGFRRLFRRVAPQHCPLPVFDSPPAGACAANDAGDLAFLFDPGVGGASLGRLSDLPLAKRLRRVAEQAYDDVERRALLVRQTEKVAFIPQLCLAIRTADGELVGVLARTGTEAGMVGIEKMLFIRAAMLGLGVTMEEALRMPFRFETESQQTAFRLVLAVAHAWMRHSAASSHESLDTSTTPSGN